MFLKEVRDLEFIGYAIVAFIAFWLGVIAEHKTIKAIGTLIVDRTDREKPPYLYLQLDHTDWEKVIDESQHVSFRVRYRN